MRLPALKLKRVSPSVFRDHNYRGALPSTVNLDRALDEDLPPTVGSGIPPTGQQGRVRTEVGHPPEGGAQGVETVVVTFLSTSATIHSVSSLLPNLGPCPPERLGIKSSMLAFGATSTPRLRSRVSQPDANQSK